LVRIMGMRWARMEKRVDRRYSIPVRAVLSFVDAPTQDLRTSNISAAGAFIETDHTCLEGTEIFMTLFKGAELDESGIEGSEAFKLLFKEAMPFENMLTAKFKARIVRCFNRGMAVSFDRAAT